jgi:DNA repair exonuclease SbcCD ATPase subunit
MTAQDNVAPEQQPETKTSTTSDSIDNALHHATESLQKLANRLQEEASPYVSKARDLIDRAESLYQDLRQNISQKIDEQTSSNESARDALSLIKDAQQEAEDALKALRADFEQLRKLLIDVQQSSELKTYIQKLMNRLNLESETESEQATTAVQPVEIVSDGPADMVTKVEVKPRTRRKSTKAAASEDAPEADA